MVFWRCWFLIQTYIFEILTQKSIFGKIWAQNVKVVRFVWKLAHMVSQGCWFLFLHWFSEILTPKLIFRQIWAKKGKVVRFAWKLAHMVSRECWLLFQHLFSEFQTINQFLGKFLGKFGPKKSNSFVLPENWHILYLEDADSYSEISFLNFKT